MNLNNIPQNGLPKELMSLPYGQIFILTSPYEGISFLHIRMAELVFSVSRNYHPEHIVQFMPIMESELWDCAVCKVKSEDGDEMIISSKASLLEMLCELWGLDIDTVSENGRLYEKARNKEWYGEKHPIKVPIVIDNGESSLAKELNVNNYIINKTLY